MARALEVLGEMIGTSFLHKECNELFADYPLASRAVDHGGKRIRSMVLMLHNDGDTAFFVLSRDCCDGRFSYSLCPWPSGDVVDIQADGDTIIPQVAADAVAQGVPIPQDGSLFGWKHRDTITALVVVYTEYTLASAQPSWAVMPLAGAPEELWPPFTNERFLGHWFWEYHRAGSIIFLADLVAGMPDTVYWVDTKAALGSDCCAVARDVRSPGGSTLRRGRYVYQDVLRTGKMVPPLAVLLADTSKTDLAPLFQQHSDGCSRGGGS